MLTTTRIHAHQLADGTAYDVYVPPSYDGSRPYQLLVSVLPVHPNIPIYRALELFSDLADAKDYLLVAPRFEMSSGFQFLGIGTPVRHDVCLVDIIHDVRRTYDVEPKQFNLFGYSAGGQFAHRFMYLHRDRLRAVAVGAPGTVTLASTADNWPAGLADVRAVFGGDTNVGGAGEYWPRILLFVGDKDVSTEMLSQTEESNRFGLTRVERARTLHAAWLAASIAHEYVEVPGMEHGDAEAMDRLMPRVWQFFLDSSASF